MAELELSSAVAESGARGGWVVVMDPTNGEILAMAAVPAFAPNLVPQMRPSRWVNPAVSEAHEPGSPFKIFLMAAALDSGAGLSTDRFHCGGALTAPGGAGTRHSPDKRHARR